MNRIPSRIVPPAYRYCARSRQLLLDWPTGGRTGAETALILAQRERWVSNVKWMIGERGERLVRTS